MPNKSTKRARNKQRGAGKRGEGVKHELTELGKRVRVWQVVNGVSMNELCRMVRERTQAASPWSYIWSVLCGIRRSEKVTAALEDIITGK